MRQITFRAKDIENDQQWRYGSLINYPNGNPVIVTFDKDGKELSYDVNPDTLGQYTGLKDRNGKDIYEGDILVLGENDCKSQPIIVMFKHGSFGYTYTEDWFHSFAGNTNFTFNPLNTDVRFEIIGNIHDNPELLKGGAK